MGEGPSGRDDREYWRERAEQLQQALETRVVIEQAKGILSERFGLGVEGAFGLLRHAARRNRIKLHVLARAVVEHEETPDAVVETLALHVDGFTALPREERVLLTEELFKRINDSIAAGLSEGSREFLCECGNPLCNETIELSADDLRLLHSQEGFYAFVPGHQMPDLETVVAEHERYAVVRKTERLRRSA